MKQHKVQSSVQPQEIEITPDAVFIAKNIHEYTTNIDDHIQTGYEFDCIEYTKDEYLIVQNEKIATLEQELTATKILLGVD